jgi:hypothetical protein
MAKNSIRDYDATAANNTDVQSTDISEGCAASGINNAIREVMADLKDVSTGTVALETPAADRLDVDNIRIDGNTISSTDTNGDITLDPDGTGDLIVASGNVGIGTTDPVSKFNVDTGDIALSRTTDGDGNELGEFMFWNRTNAGSGTGTTFVNDVASIQGKMVGTGNNSGGSLHFYTKPDAGDKNERMRIDGSGNVMVGTTSTSAATEQGIILKPAEGLHMNNSTTNAGVSLILLYSSYSTTDQTKFEVNAAGDVKSRTNSYGAFSDERLKEQIADAPSQWDDIKAIEVKNFKFISDLDDADNPKMLGVIAQQVEQVSPGLVEDDPKDDMKTVKYSLLYMKAVKALQEAMTRIETLETQRADLEARLTALENA